MAVPVTNTSLSGIQTEFGGSNPISLSEYYSAGPLVPSGSPAPNGPIPSSGQISIGQFRGAVKALFVAATGGTVTTSGDYKIHTFNGPGTFTVTSAGNAAGSNAVGYQIIAGGGGGGSKRGGGGGAGGYREGKTAGYTASPLATPTLRPVSVQGYGITVGAGGVGENGQGSNPHPPAGKGANSSGVSITSTGGGNAGKSNSPGTPGAPGGSGGGATNHDGGTKTGGTGNSPPVSPSQGRNGGGSGPLGGGGGGGAAATGGSSPLGAGGSGTTSSITGSPVARAGGGGGGAGPTSGSTPPSLGGGGRGGLRTAGATNSGSGGGGGNDTALTGGAGGKGRVVIRYKFQ